MIFSKPMTLYVIRCVTPNHFYVGTTLRDYNIRYQEHKDGYGSRWTARPGCRNTVTRFTVECCRSAQKENEVWMFYARRYGPENVRGGDVTILGPITPSLLPEEFGGTRRVDWGDGLPEFSRG